MRFKRKAENREWVIKRTGRTTEKEQNRSYRTRHGSSLIITWLCNFNALLLTEREADEERERESFVLMSLWYFLCIPSVSPVQESICLTVVVDVIESGDSRGFRREWDQNCVTIVLLCLLDPYPSTLQRAYSLRLKYPVSALLGLRRETEWKT